jgi:hypothetical protein
MSPIKIQTRGLQLGVRTETCSMAGLTDVCLGDVIYRIWHKGIPWSPVSIISYTRKTVYSGETSHSTGSPTYKEMRWRLRKQPCHMPAENVGGGGGQESICQDNRSPPDWDLTHTENEAGTRRLRNSCCTEQFMHFLICQGTKYSCSILQPNGFNAINISKHVSV